MLEAEKGSSIPLSTFLTTMSPSPCSLSFSAFFPYFTILHYFLQTVLLLFGPFFLFYFLKIFLFYHFIVLLVPFLPFSSCSRRQQLIEGVIYLKMTHFKKCISCGVKLPSLDMHDFCLSCLRKYQVQTCPYCACFTKQARKNCVVQLCGQLLESSIRMEIHSAFNTATQGRLEPVFNIRSNSFIKT